MSIDNVIERYLSESKDAVLMKVMKDSKGRVTDYKVLDSGSTSDMKKLSKKRKDTKTDEYVVLDYSDAMGYEDLFPDIMSHF